MTNEQQKQPVEQKPSNEPAPKGTKLYKGNAERVVRTRDDLVAAKFDGWTTTKPKK